MILIGLIFAIVSTWTIIYFNNESVSEHNDNRFKDIYSNENYYE